MRLGCLTQYCHAMLWQEVYQAGRRALGPAISSSRMKSYGRSAPSGNNLLYVLPWGAATATIAFVAWQLGRRSSGEEEKGQVKGEGADPAISEILSLWFDGDVVENYKSKWFCPPNSPQQVAFDELVSSGFSALLDKAVQGKLDRWTKTPRGLLALVILLDQFPRHIYRHAEDRSSRLEATDKLALLYAEQLRASGWVGSMTVPQQIFGLMPLRHSPSLERLQLVIADIDARASSEHKAMELLTRFRKTTLRRMQGLEGRVPDDAEILEHLSFVADESDLPSHAVARSMLDFLQAFLLAAQGQQTTAVAVSLSGGVDSMVIAKCLVHFKQQFGYEVVALHLDYANRSESGREADFVESWCAQQGITFRKRVVSEVTRGVTARDEYERVSRDIRFAFYEEVLGEFGCPAVMFGHHQGDLQENVISNVMRGCGPLQLSGMSKQSTVNKVVVWRPLLELSKDAIFDFAHRYGVPYFKDTTPTWSTRGKLRRQLVPLLADMYGEGFKANLSSLAHQSDELRDVVNAALLDPFLHAVVRTPLASHVDVRPFKDQSVFFWREVLRTLVHSMGQGKITDKGVAQLQRHVSSRDFSSREFWFELRKDYAVLLLDSRLFIFKPHAVQPADGSGAYPPQGPAVPFNHPITLEPWRVHATLHPPSDTSEQLCTRPVVSGATAFCDGSFNYHLLLRKCSVCGSWPILRVMREGYKKLTPWQHVEVRLKRSVPVVVPVCQTCDGAKLPPPPPDMGPINLGDLWGQLLVRVSYAFVGFPSGGQQPGAEERGRQKEEEEHMTTTG